MASKAERKRNKRAFSKSSTVTQGADGQAVVRLVDGRRIVLGAPYAPERWGPVPERPVQKRARTWIVDVLLEKGRIGPDHVAAAREIATVFTMVAGSSGCRAADPNSAGGGGREAEVSAEVAMLKVRFYDPWCDALMRIQKLGGSPLLGVTFDRVCLMEDLRTVARAHRLRIGSVDACVVESLGLYVSMRQARSRKSAKVTECVDTGKHSSEVVDRARQPRPKLTDAAARRLGLLPEDSLAA